jgi:hypothetical protein
MLLKPSALCGSNPSFLLASTIACANGCSLKISAPAVQAKSSSRLVPFNGKISETIGLPKVIVRVLSNAIALMFANASNIFSTFYQCSFC